MGDYQVHAERHRFGISCFAAVAENSFRLAASRCVHDCSFKRRQYVSIAPGKNNRRT
jgi:hypothetical protein